MKIGLLAYHAACNYGAFLQLLSTIEYVRKRGDEPRVINWVPKDFAHDYEKRSRPEVRNLFSKYQNEYFPLTTLCTTAKEVAEVILKEKIEAVIIGSDAVCQHHPFRERFRFPVRRIIYIAHVTSDRMYPNCFWGMFNKYLQKSVPLALISGSSQDSKYYYIKGRTLRRMQQDILSFKYYSVRDEWTQKMVGYLTNEKFVPDITPDPVFAFNQNASELIPTKAYILNRFHIPENYLLVSFKNSKSVSQEWISSFEKLAKARGLSCVKLPYADIDAFGKMKHDIKMALSPLEWYALIKYSKGYVGNNMHPIVTSIHNRIPFFSFDNYGISNQNGKSTNGESSKIYHVLNLSGLLKYRVFINSANYVAPSPISVLDAIQNFETNIEDDFASSWLDKYNEMMRTVFNSLTKQ